MIFLYFPVFFLTLLERMQPGGGLHPGGLGSGSLDGDGDDDECEDKDAHE